MTAIVNAPSSSDRGHILQLPSEILIAILECLEDDPSKLIKPDLRAYLSQESFSFPPEEPQTPRAQNIGCWRLVCRKFSEAGAIVQFTRISLRFSANEFRRLENIASNAHLASAVRKFSYLVPCFYYGKDRNGDELRDLIDLLGEPGKAIYANKFTEQKSILDSGTDLQVLFKALSAFKILQHVQMLPILDHQDRELLRYIRGGSRELFEGNWAWACSYATDTVSEVLLQSHSPCSRFSSPRLNPQTAIRLRRPSDFISLASQLTCLELHFDDGAARLDAKMQELSPMLKTILHSAERLESVHVGFPSHRPIELALEDIFGNIRWNSLVCFGIQGWKLKGVEIVELAKRHCKTLRGLRLRDVLLKDDSRWKDVLKALHVELKGLRWCSLRRIGYAAKFDADMSLMGADVNDDPPGGDSESESESSEGEGLGDDNLSIDLHTNGHVVHGDHHYDSDMDDDDTYSEHSHQSGDEHTMAHNTMEFPEVIVPDENEDEVEHATPATSPSSLWPMCHDHPLSLENAGDFADDGVQVDRKTRKVWEKWVICKRPHSSLAHHG